MIVLILITVISAAIYNKTSQEPGEFVNKKKRNDARTKQELKEESMFLSCVFL